MRRIAIALVLVAAVSGCEPKSVPFRLCVPKSPSVPSAYWCPAQSSGSW